MVDSRKSPISYTVFPKRLVLSCYYSDIHLTIWTILAEILLRMYAIEMFHPHLSNASTLYERNATRNPKVIWEKPRRHPWWQRITTPQSPHWLQWDVPHLPPKLPLPLTITTPSSTPLPRPTPHTIPNGIRIPDPISRFATVHFLNRRTDRPTDRQMV